MILGCVVLLVQLFRGGSAPLRRELRSIGGGVPWGFRGGSAPLRRELRSIGGGGFLVVCTTLLVMDLMCMFLTV